MLAKGKKIIGALIGFALGLHVASTLFITLFSGHIFFSILDKIIVIFVFVIVVGAFSFFGSYHMANVDYLKKRRRN